MARAGSQGVMKPFDVNDPGTWSSLMTVAEIAAIYRRTPDGLRKACQKHRFVPAPFKGPKPYLWRKADVERDVFGNRAPLRKVS